MALDINSTGDKNGGPVIVFSEELYLRFKEALLGNAPPLIADENDPRDFVGRQRKALSHNPREKVGHWLKTQSPIVMRPARPQDRFGTAYVYETSIKCIPPMASDAREECVRRFHEEFALPNTKVRLYKDTPEVRAYLIERGDDPDSVNSTVPIDWQPGDTDHIIKLQIAEDAFAVLRDHIHMPDVAAPARHA